MGIGRQIEKVSQSAELGDGLLEQRFMVQADQLTAFQTLDEGACDSTQVAMELDTLLQGKTIVDRNRGDVVP